MIKFLKWYWKGADLQAKINLVMLPIMSSILLLEIVVLILLIIKMVGD